MVARRSGSPVICFLHGLAGHGREWNAVVDHLEPSVGFIIPDQRGHGANRALDDVAIERCTLAADAIALIESSGVAPVILVGQSMGGIVATLVAHDRPDLVSHLVLIEAGIGPMSEADFAGLQRWFDSWPDRFSDRAEAAQFFGVDAASTPAWVDGLHEDSSGLRARFDPDVMIAIMRALATRDRSAEWAELTAPVLLIRGEASAIGDEEYADMQRTNPHAQLVEVPNSGHDVHLDQPARVARLIEDFIETEEMY